MSYLTPTRLERSAQVSATNCVVNTIDPAQEAWLVRLLYP
jgi:hypothetical protein